MQRIFLHIGSPKCGTSSIQKFINEHEKILLTKGIFSPKLKIGDNHRAITIFSKERTIRNIRENNLIIRAEYNVEKYDEEFIKVWKGEIEKSKGKDIILSSEHLFSINKKGILKIKEILTGFDVKVIGYIRRQDELLASNYSQMIKSGFTKKLSLTLLEHSLLYNFNKTLSKWANHFGSKNMIVRPFKKELWYENNLFADFMNCIGHNLPIVDSNLYHKNPSIDRYNVEYLRLLNSNIIHPLSIKDQNIKGVERNRIIKILEKNSLSNEKIKFGFETTQKILKKFSKSNLNLIRNFMPEYIDLVNNNLSFSDQDQLPEFDIERAMLITSQIITKLNDIILRN